MSNPDITVISALYGVPTKTFDVTQKVQEIFDQQYTGGRKFTLIIGYGTFATPDPAPGDTKSFTIVYNLPKVGSDIFMRGAQDNQTLTLMPGPISNPVGVMQAIYVSNNMGLDVTDKLKAWLRDPEFASNPSLGIGFQSFLDALTNGSDPAPGATKYFSVTFTDSGAQQQRACGCDGQTIQLA